MSLGKQKNLIILGAVAAALLAGGVLVAGYTDMLPGQAKADDQVKPCPFAGAGVTCAAKAETAGFPQVVAATEAVPARACCGAEKPAGACCNPGGDCDRCEKPAGGCGEPGAAKSCCPSEVPKSCCAAKADAATE